MVLIYNQVIVPPDQANKAAQSWIDWMKNNPPDRSIEKNLCIGVRSTEDGNILVIGVSEVVKGKVKEALELGTKQDLFIAAKIPGCKYKVEVMLDITEAYKTIGMTAPEV